MLKHVAVCLAALLVVSSLALGDDAATATLTKVTAKAGNFGNVTQSFVAENSPKDKLCVEITDATLENGKYISYVRVIWGDLDDLVKGERWYSPWPGYVDLGDATGEVIKTYHFNTGEPKVGTGHDKLVSKSGNKIEWIAAVTGCYDGVLIKVTSDKPNTPVKVSTKVEPVTAEIKPSAPAPVQAAAPAPAPEAVAAPVVVQTVPLAATPVAPLPSTAAPAVDVPVAAPAPKPAEQPAPAAPSVGVQQIE
jgi:hypothetical protein